MQTVSQSQRLLADAVDGFLGYLGHVRGLSPHTVFHYGHDLSLFLRYCAKQQECSVLQVTTSDVTPTIISNFLQFLHEERGNSNRSIKRRLAALRSFFSYISDPNEQQSNPAQAVPVPKAVEQPPRILSSEDALRLLRAARAHGPDPIRDYAILRLFLHCGARLSEVLELRLDDIDLEEGYVHIDANGKRTRVVPLSSETSCALAQYLASRPHSSSDRVFISRNLRPITKGAIYHMIGKCLSNAGLDRKKVNIHTLRHTCFTLLAKEGFEVEELQQLAGLARPQMPKEYMRLANESPDFSQPNMPKTGQNSSGVDTSHDNDSTTSYT